MSCLKKIVGLFGLVIMAGGIFLIVFTSIKLSEKSYSLFSQAGWDWGEVLTIVTLIIGCLMFLLGIFGVYGGCKRNKCCLCIYTPGIFIIAAILLTIAIMSTIAFTNYNSSLSSLQLQYEQNCAVITEQNANVCNSKYCGSEDSGLEWISTLSSNVNNAGQQFGSNGANGCQIYAEQQELRDKITAYRNSFNIPGTNITGQSSNLAKSSVLNCPNLQEKSTILGIGTLMVFFETNFQCSGICQPYPYYLFSNVNDSPNWSGQGTPCFQKIVSFWNDYGVQIQIITYIVGSVIFLNVILVLVLCCKKDKKDNKNIYTNMDYLD